MEWVSNWIQGVIVAVIIGTIIEMILPEGNCKKYVKVVIGIYILYSMVSPVITKVTKNDLKVSNIFDLNEYIEASKSNTYENLEQSQENQIKNIYESNLKNDMTEKLEAKGYEVININLNIESSSEYTLKNIELMLEEKDKSNVETNTVEMVNEINIQIGNNETQKNEKTTYKISEKEKKELKSYLSSIYNIEEKNISINEEGR